MPLRLRRDDEVDPDGDRVLRAGGGDVDALTRSAIENARDYEHLLAGGQIRSAYTISVHIPRVGVADEDEILGSPAYPRYKPYLHAEARDLLNWATSRSWRRPRGPRASSPDFSTCAISGSPR